MKPDQLREAIEKRLALAGARAEEGLTDALLADAGTEPGNLALLEHALAQLWERDIWKVCDRSLDEQTLRGDREVKRRDREARAGRVYRPHAGPTATGPTGSFSNWCISAKARRTRGGA